MVDTGSCLQNPQDVPSRESLTMVSPLSLPRMSGKTSDTQKKKRDARTFKDDSIFWAPEVAERSQGIGHYIYRFRFIGENV